MHTDLFNLSLVALELREGFTVVAAAWAIGAAVVTGWLIVAR